LCGVEVDSKGSGVFSPILPTHLSQIESGVEAVGVRGKETCPAIIVINSVIVIPLVIMVGLLGLMMFVTETGRQFDHFQFFFVGWFLDFCECKGRLREGEEKVNQRVSGLCRSSLIRSVDGCSLFKWRYGSRRYAQPERAY